ncbi:MAG: hypothetical protein JST22_17895, partial [Bacteroidetes bacterium]|nr:hypothetical protein [Bacteroidota bacterium]
MTKTVTISVAALCLCAIQAFGQGRTTMNPLLIGSIGSLQASAPNTAARIAAVPDNEALRDGRIVPPGEARVASSNHLLQTLDEVWVNGAWQNSNRTTSTYDGSGYESSSLAETWDTVANVWQPATKDTYTNNSKGMPTQILEEDWNDTSHAWVNASRLTYTYNASDKVSQMLAEMWTGDAWLNNFRTTQTFDGSGYTTKALSEEWDAASSSWKPFQQLVYTNNTDGTVQQSVFQLWDTTGSTWTNYYRVSYTYNSAGKVTQEQTDFYLNSIWFPIRRTTNTYDANNNLVHSLDETSSFGTGTWTNSQQADYTNNAEGRPTLILGQNWDGASSSWVNGYRTTNTYDTPG